MTCAASLAVLREMKRIDAPANAKKVGDYFAAELAKMPHVVEVRHRGLFVGVQLEEGINAVEVKRHCIKNHFLVTAIGSSVIRMVPPLIVRGVDCDKAVEILSSPSTRSLRASNLTHRNFDTSDRLTHASTTTPHHLLWWGVVLWFFPQTGSRAKRQDRWNPCAAPQKKHGDLWGKGEWTGPGSHGTIFLAA